MPGAVIGARARSWIWWLRWLMLVTAAVFYALHFVHLRADFPNHSPWVDWSKYTDEGWYGDAAIRHYTSGHWYWKGDFNPAVALPVWPLLEGLWFGLTGVGPAAARSLTLLVFGATLVVFYVLLERNTRAQNEQAGPSLAAPIALLLLTTSPLLFVFERMAILEPLVIALTALALLVASSLQPLHLRGRSVGRLVREQWPAVALGVLLPAMVLTKTTAICLLPAVLYMVWARAGYRLRPALRLAALPCALGLALWCAYFFVLVKPHYLEDYRYLFSANAYTGFELDPLATVVLNTISDGAWMGLPLYIAFYATLALALFWRPRVFRNPLAPSLVLWVAGYFAFLAYHNNLQPRYYTVIAVPATVLVALGLDSFRRATTRAGHHIGALVAAVVVCAIAVPDAAQQIEFVRQPTYEFLHAAQEIRTIVMADRTHPHLILSISGSDITLMTGLPSIDDDFGTLELGERVKQYRPGWYVAWNELDDDKADALTPLYHVVRVAAFPAMDDPDRNLLILYRLDPATPEPPRPRRRRHLPKQLVTKMGQQPSESQLIH